MIVDALKPCSVQSKKPDLVRFGIRGIGDVLWSIKTMEIPLLNFQRNATKFLVLQDDDMRIGIMAPLVASAFRHTPGLHRCLRPRRVLRAHGEFINDLIDFVTF